MSIDVFKLGRCLCPLGHRRAVGPSCIGPGPLLATGIRSQRQKGEPRTDLRAWGTERSFKPFALNEIKDLNCLCRPLVPGMRGRFGSLTNRSRRPVSRCQTSVALHIVLFSWIRMVEQARRLIRNQGGGMRDGSVPISAHLIVSSK